MSPQRKEALILVINVSLKNIQLLFAPMEKDDILAAVHQMLESSHSTAQKEG